MLPPWIWPVAGCLAFPLIACPAPALLAQTRRPLNLEAAIGAFIPTTDLGTVSVTTGRLGSGPAGLVALALNPRFTWPVGFRFGGAASFAGRTLFRATEGCVGSCLPTSDDDGTLRAVFADITLTVPISFVDIRLAAGPAIRQYHYPDLICACDPPLPGELWVIPFLSRQTAAALHAAVGVALRRAGRGAPFVQAELLASGSQWHVAQRDLLVSVGLRW